MTTNPLALRALRSIAAAVCFTALGAAPAWAASQTGPSALLAVDQNRATVIDRIVADWGAALVNANAGISTLRTSTRSANAKANKQ